MTDLPLRSRGVIAFVVAGQGAAARVLLLKRKSAPVGAWAQDSHAWLDVEAALAQLTFAGHQAALQVIRRDFLDRTPDPLKRITP